MPKLCRRLPLFLVIAAAGALGCNAAPTNNAGALGGAVGAPAAKQAPAKRGQGVQAADGSSKMGGVIEDKKAVEAKYAQ